MKTVSAYYIQELKSPNATKAEIILIEFYFRCDHGIMIESNACFSSFFSKVPALHYRPVEKAQDMVIFQPTNSVYLYLSPRCMPAC